MTFSKKIFISCLFVSLITVTSCGYSLKKSTNELSQKEIVVIADNSDLNLELIYQLKVKGNEITRSKEDRKRKRLNSSHLLISRMTSSA